MNGIATHDAAERDCRIIRLAVLFGSIESDRDRRRNLQRARHRNDVVRNASGFQLGDRALHQRILDVVIESRLDDQRARARNVGLVFQRGAPCVCHQLPSVLLAGRRFKRRMSVCHFISDSRAA